MRAKPQVVLSEEKDPIQQNLDELMVTNFGDNWKPELNRKESVAVLNPDLLKSALLLKLEDNNLIGYFFTKFMIGLNGKSSALADSLKVDWGGLLGVFKGKILNIVGRLVLSNRRRMPAQSVRSRPNEDPGKLLQGHAYRVSAVGVPGRPRQRRLGTESLQLGNGLRLRVRSQTRGQGRDAGGLMPRGV